jgi:hypothetical protein
LIGLNKQQTVSPARSGAQENKQEFFASFLQKRSFLSLMAPTPSVLRPDLPVAVMVTVAGAARSRGRGEPLAISARMRARTIASIGPYLS